MSAVNMSTCAACGKDGDGDCLKACKACKFVKYCNVTCQKAHRPKHKKLCKKRAAEIFDEAIFKTPPPKDDCPICFLRLPLCQSEIEYQSCCGKSLCIGCVYADEFERAAADCPFCRTPIPTSEDGLLERIKTRVEANDILAMHYLGHQYFFRGNGVPQDYKKALELWNRAAKLGCANSH
ncbi:hypothetical protein ACHAXR_000357, partial [Thalassiosira sp. AJA248-18]